MERKHIISKDCWCQPTVLDYHGEEHFYHNIAEGDTFEGEDTDEEETP